MVARSRPVATIEMISKRKAGLRNRTHAASSAMRRFARMASMMLNARHAKDSKRSPFATNGIAWGKSQSPPTTQTPTNQKSPATRRRTESRRLLLARRTFDTLSIRNPFPSTTHEFVKAIIRHHSPATTAHEHSRMAFCLHQGELATARHQLLFHRGAAAGIIADLRVR